MSGHLTTLSLGATALFMAAAGYCVIAIHFAYAVWRRGAAAERLALHGFMVALALPMAAHCVTAALDGPAWLQWMLESISGGLGALSVSVALSRNKFERLMISLLIGISGGLVALTLALGAYPQWAWLPDLFGFAGVFWALRRVIGAKIGWVRRVGFAALVPAVLTVVVSPSNRRLNRMEIGLAFFPIFIVVVQSLLGDFSDAVRAIRDRTEALHSKYVDGLEVQARLVAQSQLATLGAFASVVAHELRSPLAVLRNGLSALRKQQKDPQAIKAIIRQELARLATLSGALLDFARVQTMRPGRIDVPELFGTAIDMAAARIEAADGVSPGCAVRVECSVSEHVRGDARMLADALARLIDNAVRATRHGGDVTVRGELLPRSEGVLLKLAVRDSGSGMEPMVLERALDPFFTLRASGTGLGLPLAGQVALQHGGRLTLRSMNGVGTEVVLWLPTEVLP